MTIAQRNGITTQGSILYQHFSKEYPGRFIATSAKPNRYHRLLDMILTLLGRRREISIQCLSVYSGDSFIVADICSAVGRMLGQKVVLHLHGGALPDMFNRRPGWSRRVLSRAHAIVAPSPFLARAVESLGFDSIVIPNIIDLGDYPYRLRSQAQPRLFWMRSFHPIWNPDMAVRVLSSLRRDGVEASLVMGGPDKGHLDETRQLAQGLHVSEFARFAGFLGPNEKACAGDAADIFLNTNRIDNMPVAVIEAGAMGLPVISTNVGGISDLLTHGVTGLLVPSDDAEAMAGCVRHLLKDRDLCRSLSANGRQLAERFDWPIVRQQWLALFDRLGAKNFSGPATQTGCATAHGR